jgi:hypothetical protein
MLNITIKNGPVGLPFAAKISEVTPISDDISVRYPFPSKIQKNTVINSIDESHKLHSNIEKYFNKPFMIPQKRHP